MSNMFTTLFKMPFVSSKCSAFSSALSAIGACLLCLLGSGKDQWVVIQMVLVDIRMSQEKLK